MNFEENTTPKNKTWYYRKCPNCGKRLHVERMYCVCKTDLKREPFYEVESIQPPQLIDRLNIETPTFTCDSCMGNCKFCASFSTETKNSDGWGGLDCKYYNSTQERCTCCHLIIRNMAKYGRYSEQSIKEAMEGMQRIIQRREAGEYARGAA